MAGLVVAGLTTWQYEGTTGKKKHEHRISYLTGGGLLMEGLESCPTIYCAAGSFPATPRRGAGRGLRLLRGSFRWRGPARAGGDVVGFGMPLRARPVAADVDRPSGHFHLPLLKFLRAHRYAPAAPAAAPRSTGTPTRLPHSVHEPS